MKALSPFLVVLSLIISIGCSSVDPDVSDSIYKSNQQVSELMKAISVFEHLHDRFPQSPNELNEFISNPKFKRDLNLSLYRDLKFEQKEDGIMNVSFKQINFEGIGEQVISIDFKPTNKAPIRDRTPHR